MINLKNLEQIKRIRESCKLLAQMYFEIRPLVVEGISTLELDEWATDFILKRGGKPAFRGYMGFPGTLCTSINEEVIHGIPGKRKLKEGDIVSLDCGINLGGYFSDAALTIGVGQIGIAEKQLLMATDQSLYKGIEAAITGNRIRDIGRAVSGHVKPYGYGVVHQFCGHAVGLHQHEDPQIPNYVGSGPSPRIVPGMVLAIEPMINMGKAEVKTLEDDWTVVTIDKKKSAHFEHTVAVLESGTEILTLLD